MSDWLATRNGQMFLQNQGKVARSLERIAKCLEAAENRQVSDGPIPRGRSDEGESQRTLKDQKERNAAERLARQAMREVADKIYHGTADEGDSDVLRRLALEWEYGWPVEAP